jgi:hypothetical protein
VNEPVDIRAFYAALGIALPEWSTHDAPVRCFAQPEAHNHNDRSASCSVNLATGTWNCHGCGAHGGAYDAALATGHTPRSAMELLIEHGLAQPRTPDRAQAANGRISSRRRRPHRPTIRSELAWNDADVHECAERLDADSRLIRRLALERAWSLRTIRELDLGFDGARLTIPIRNRAGELRGVLGYDPFGRRDPKMRAVQGTRLGLMPHPARETSQHIILVEGPPDAIAARSAGLPAIAVPGTHAWKGSSSQLLQGRRITIVMDCDPPGRQAADQIAHDLAAAATAVEIVDLWPGRDDGYDLTDRILERRRLRAGPSTPRTVASLLRPARSRHTNSPRPPDAPRPGAHTMTDASGVNNNDYTHDARNAILAAVREQHDFAGWLASVLSAVAADLGSSDALIAGRPGSWEADLIRQLVKGTIGWADDYRADYKEPLP